MTTFGPYSPIRESEGLFFVSGQIGIDLQTKSVPKDIQTQSSLALSNLSDLLEANGLDMDDIVKTTVFLTDMDNFSAFNDIYEGFFLPPRPARSTVAVKELPRIGKNPLLVEIEAIARKKK